MIDGSTKLSFTDRRASIWIAFGMKVGHRFDCRGILVIRSIHVLIDLISSVVWLLCGVLWSSTPFDLIWPSFLLVTIRPPIARNFEKSSSPRQPRRCRQHPPRLVPASPSELRPRRNKVCHHLRHGTTTNSYDDYPLSKTSCGVNCLKSCGS